MREKLRVLVYVVIDSPAQTGRELGRHTSSKETRQAMGEGKPTERQQMKRCVGRALTRMIGFRVCGRAGNDFHKKIVSASHRQSTQTHQ